MAALKPPFKASNHLNLAIKIKNGKYERIPDRYSDELWSVIQLMLQLKTDRRPSVDELLKLPMVAQRQQQVETRI